MNFRTEKTGAGIARWSKLAMAVSALLFTTTTQAGIDGETGSTFDLVASEGNISIPDGASIYSWGYSVDGQEMQLPGPTLIVTAGANVNITLTNQLPSAAGNVSIVFPGHQVTATGGVTGALTNEAIPGGTVAYSFDATTPGTYQYHSGTQQDLQVEMGLYGAIVVRPADVTCAYENENTCFDREHLFLISEVDLDIHQAAQLQASGPGPIVIETGSYNPEYWLLNGRAAPDTMAAAGRDGQLPNQPYNVVPRMHPGEKLLLRVVGAGRQLHPFHTHGNHAKVLARDGRLLLSASNTGRLAGPELFTIPTLPGGTVDAMFEWTGEGLGWDVYGHAPSDPEAPNEYSPDHGIPLPVELPNLTSLAFGGFYSGSPFLGSLGALPPGEGGLNPNSGFAYMWHSHHGKEQVNNDIFPGGIMTMLIVEPQCPSANAPDCDPIP